MCRKAFFWVGGLGLVAVTMACTEATSYVGTSLGWVGRSMKDSVPVEFEIERARQMCQDLKEPIEQNMRIIAREEGEVERLSGDISKADQRLKKEKTDLMTLRTDLASTRDFYVYAGRRYSQKQVKKDLAARLARYQTGEETLGNLQNIHSARVRSLDASRQKLEEMLSAKRQLEADVENLEARLKMVEVAQTTSQYNIDDSDLGRVKELVNDVQARLTVAEKLANADIYFEGEIPVSAPSEEDVLANFDAFFETDRAEAEVASAGSIELE